MSVLALFAQNNQGNAGAGTGAFLGLVCAGLLLGFLPTIVATLQGHQNGTAIFILNLLLGWDVYRVGRGLGLAIYHG